MIGIALALQSLLSMVLLLVPSMLAMAYRVRIEEAELRKAIGAAYVEYASQTRRFIPYLL